MARKENRDCSFEEMAGDKGGQSIPQPYWNEPPHNAYEQARKSFYGPNGFDWSEMRREK
jgi:hypothetical protein